MRMLYILIDLRRKAIAKAGSRPLFLRDLFDLSSRLQTRAGACGEHAAEARVTGGECDAVAMPILVREWGWGEELCRPFMTQDAHIHGTTAAARAAAATAASVSNWWRTEGEGREAAMTGPLASAGGVDNDSKMYRRAYTSNRSSQARSFDSTGRNRRKLEFSAVSSIVCTEKLGYNKYGMLMKEGLTYTIYTTNLLEAHASRKGGAKGKAMSRRSIQARR
ncbi:hypothetical protein R3P38DRAFT_3542421 [Favolaschia claudopus]|uniref:Uncharacterized protein n=1 Tax=Favolaschia claudopus TaxID=2862362 RepID=A0AAW0B6K7_9AGAR